MSMIYGPDGKIEKPTTESDKIANGPPGLHGDLPWVRWSRRRGSRRRRGGSWLRKGRGCPTRVEDLGVERRRDDDGEEQWRVQWEDDLRRKRTTRALIVSA
jgi:hypothetical protein